MHKGWQAHLSTCLRLIKVQMMGRENMCKCQRKADLARPALFIRQGQRCCVLLVKHIRCIDRDQFNHSMLTYLHL